jgi:signal recognition particle receptor subunit alpha
MLSCSPALSLRIISSFNQGYDRDPVLIARAAIKQAADTGVDVVLVDTAGRMTNNGPLMQQLAKLVAVNAPDLVLFVGEALVGNDGVAQLVEFDRALVDYAADRERPRRIDGIVLTKFDTIDDKVRERRRMGRLVWREIVGTLRDSGRRTRVWSINLPLLRFQVGAALSMVHRTSIPIVFLGVGQQYGDLRRLNAGAVVKALMA